MHFSMGGGARHRAAARSDPALHFRGQLCGRGRRLEPRLRASARASCGNHRRWRPFRFPLCSIARCHCHSPKVFRERIHTYRGFCEGWMTRLREIDAGSRNLGIKPFPNAVEGGSLVPFHGALHFTAMHRRVTHSPSASSLPA